MAGSVSTYAFINAKLRARISKLVSSSFFERLAGAHSLPEALALLGETPYGVLSEIYEKTGDLKLGELELFRREVRLYRELEKYLQGEVLEFLQTLAMRYEIDTLKNALRIFFDRKVRGRPIDAVVHYVYREPILHPISIDGIMNAESLDDIIRALEGTPYAEIVAASRAAVEEERSLFRLEMELDRFFYRNLVQAAKRLNPLDRRITLRLIGVEIDLLNVGWILRFRSIMDLPVEKLLSFLLSGGRTLKQEALKEAYVTQSVGELLQKMVKSSYPGLSSLLSAQVTDNYSRLLLIERILEEIMLLEVRRMLMGDPFTIGIMLAYFILKRNEIKKVQTLLNAKQYRLPAEKVKELL